MAVLLNNQLYEDNTAVISVFDRGFTLGHGLFETLLVHQGKAPLLMSHWQRLTASAARLGIPVPVDFNEFEIQLNTLLTANQQLLGTYGVRITLTDGESARGLLGDGKQRPNLLVCSFALPAKAPKSMSVAIVDTIRNERSISSQIKHISYVDNILAKKEAVAKGYDEAVMLNSRGFVADGAMSTLFVVKDALLYTSGLADGALPGVIRGIIKQHFPVRESCLLPQDLYDADALFLTNSLMGVVRIHQLDHIMFSKPCLLTNLVSEKIRQCCGLD